ncbi:MAG: tRNA (guanosine(46)-N(7))-methyltransferase TrmB [Candidatus Binatia bacterium]
MYLGLLSADRDIGREHWLGAGAYDRVEVEIGPGSCGYLIAAARRAPRCLHVGIEIHSPSLEKVRRSPSLPPNVRLIDGDGGWIVRHLLAPASIDAFHVYFPDPWWKKRHHKRRIFQSDFCEALARTLVPGGAVYVVTDVVPVFTEIRERMAATGFCAESWVRDENDPACSSYERKYRRQGRHFELAVFKMGERAAGR